MSESRLIDKITCEYIGDNVLWTEGQNGSAQGFIITVF